ncbi:MAG: hypothetical protein ACE5G1_05030 [bacterium]
MFAERYRDDILGTNGCFDRVVVSGSIVPISYVDGLTRFLSANRILFKEFQAHAKYLAELLKGHAQSLAEEASVPYIYLSDSKTRKETLVKSFIEERGEHPGLVAVLSDLEVASSFDVFKNRERHKLELVGRQRKCLHFYFYFIDAKLGLCYFRVQSFFPFRVQIYFNGREQLARKLDEAGIGYQKSDNCFTNIDDFQSAQQLADALEVAKLHSLFDHWAEKFVCILPKLRHRWHLSYHWSIRQIEYAVDILFKSQEKLDAIYKQLLQYMTLSAMPEDIMSFLGKKLSGPQAGRIDTSTKKTYLGYRIKHRNGALSIKAYNKSGSVLRIELTINNLSQFRVSREVTKRDGQTVTKIAPLKKSIYSLEHVLRIAKAATARYIDFLSQMQDNSTGVKELRHLTERKTVDGINYKGFNPLNREDGALFEILLNGSFVTTGFKNKELRAKLTEFLGHLNWSTSKVSRLLKRLRVFGLVRRVKNSLRYLLTSKGRFLLTVAVKVKNLITIPALNYAIISVRLRMSIAFRLSFEAV